MSAAAEVRKTVTVKWLSKFQKADVWSEPAWRKGVFGSALPTQTVGELPPGRDGFIVQARSLEALFVNAAQTLFTSIATPREGAELQPMDCLLYTSPSPRDS